MTHDGAMFVGSDEGLIQFPPAKFDRPQRLPAPLDVPILSIYEDPDHVLWLGTRGHGLVRYHQGRARVFDRSQAMPDDSIYAVLEDEAGHLWLSGSRSICRVKKNLFAPDSGLPLEAAGLHPLWPRRRHPQQRAVYRRHAARRVQDA